MNAGAQLGARLSFSPMCYLRSGLVAAAFVKFTEELPEHVCHIWEQLSTAEDVDPGIEDCVE